MKARCPPTHDTETVAADRKMASVRHNSLVSDTATLRVTDRAQRRRYRLGVSFRVAIVSDIATPL